MTEPVVHRTARTYAAFKIRPGESNYFAFTADPLHDAALDLSLDIGLVDGAAHILRGDIAQYLHVASLGINFNVTKLGGEAGRLAACIE